MAMTTQKVSLLQKFLKYFEVVEMIGTAVPVAHVSAIATLLEELTAELQSAKVIPNVGVIPDQIGTGQTNQPAGFASPIAPSVPDGPTGSIKN